MSDKNETEKKLSGAALITHLEKELKKAQDTNKELQNMVNSNAIRADKLLDERDRPYDELSILKSTYNDLQHTYTNLKADFNMQLGIIYQMKRDLNIAAKRENGNNPLPYPEAEFPPVRQGGEVFSVGNVPNGVGSSSNRRY